MEVNLKGKLNCSISIQMSELLPDIIKAISSELGLGDDDIIHYTSNTKFLTFDVKRGGKS